MTSHNFEVIIEEVAYQPEHIKLLRAFKKYPYSFFLDSGCEFKKLGRFSFMGCDPFLIFKSKKDSVRLEWSDGRVEAFKSNPFHVLKDLFKKYNILNENQEIPFTSGGVGYFAYDLKDFIEDLSDNSVDDLKIPDCMLAFYDIVMICDNLKKKTYMASSGLPQVERVKNNRRREARIRDFKNLIESTNSLEEERPYLRRLLKLRSNFSKISYMEAVEKAKDYIKKGDIYQVNLSQRFETELGMEPIELYWRLRTFSPAPFSSYLDFKDVVILSSSPERFLMKRGFYIETRPIKGTRPRGEDDFSDSLLAKELLQSKKDAAEHIMIVDLERNDLGRICEYGSVIPTESMILERYSNVFHLVSTVQGRLKKKVDPIDCLMATFPGGSITGAPKIRAMEIIEELENVKRSIYTGAIGYISFDGNMDTSIVIRTLLIKDSKAFFSVGGGIIADSDPENEYEETLHKARGLMQALGICKGQGKMELALA